MQNSTLRPSPVCFILCCSGACCQTHLQIIKLPQTKCHTGVFRAPVGPGPWGSCPLCWVGNQALTRSCDTYNTGEIQWVMHHILWADVLSERISVTWFHSRLLLYKSPTQYFVIHMWFEEVSFIFCFILRASYDLKMPRKPIIEFLSG